MATTSDIAPVLPGNAAARFTRFAFSVLAFNILVVLWGAYVRATGSGAGCGSHWPLCNGDIVPRAPAIATIIEFTHRITSGFALISVLVLCVWAFRLFPKGALTRRFATLSLVFIILEALLGAGLVLFDYVAQNKSIGRAFYLSAHLANTQILLAVLALTAWFARPKGAPGLPAIRPTILGLVLPMVLIVGISGAVAALGDTLFPAISFAEGVQQEMSSTAHILLRLRVFHPALAILSAVVISFAVLAVLKQKSPMASRLAWISWGLVGLQLIAGAVNVVLLAPVWMQIIHLLLADVLWVVLVLMVVEGARAYSAPGNLSRSAGI